MATLTFLQGEKRLAYTDQGTGPVVVLVPGLGDLKESYRHLVPGLVDAGYRAICLDLRGHGESETRWDDYSVVGVGQDVVALIRHLGASAVHYVGNSMAAGAGIWAAVEAPELFRSAAFIGPFYKGRTPPLLKAALAPLFWKPWGVAMWLQYYSRLFPTAKPSDFDQHIQVMEHRMKEPGRLDATTKMMFASKEASERRIPQFSLPTLVVMGTKDPDFKKPIEEATTIAQELKATVGIVEGAGHYPQGEFPHETLALLRGFWKGVER